MIFSGDVTVYWISGYCSDKKCLDVVVDIWQFQKIRTYGQKVYFFSAAGKQSANYSLHVYGTFFCTYCNVQMQLLFRKRLAHFSRVFICPF